MERDKKFSPRTLRGKTVCYSFIQVYAANLKSLVQYMWCRQMEFYLNPMGDTIMQSAQRFLSHPQFSPSKSTHLVLYNPFYTLAKMTVGWTTTEHCQGSGKVRCCLLVFLVHQIDNEKNEKSDKIKIKGNNLLTIKKTCSAVIVNINAQTDRPWGLQGRTKLSPSPPLTTHPALNLSGFTGHPLIFS